jgi:hypothetical protein
MGPCDFRVGMLVGHLKGKNAPKGIGARYGRETPKSFRDRLFVREAVDLAESIVILDSCLDRHAGARKHGLSMDHLRVYANQTTVGPQGRFHTLILPLPLKPGEDVGPERGSRGWRIPTRARSRLGGARGNPHEFLWGVS